MDYEPYDSSGTDDDLPPSQQNRNPRGGRTAGNGRSVGIGSVTYPGMYNDADMVAQIHQLEQEAYSSVLRAFKAQADAITWEKESLLTELRKELKLSNEEHRELRGRVKADEVICKIREWRQSGGTQKGMHDGGQAAHDPVPSPSVSASRRKQKLAPSIPSQSFGGPSFHPQPMAPANHLSSSAAKRGALTGPRGKKHKSSWPEPASTKMQFPSPGVSGRGQFGNRITSGPFANESAEAATFNPLIGRKVRTRWPDDNNFYEAVITDFKPAEGLYSLVYDMGTSKETWEWVNLAEISPEDLQWVGEDPGVSQHGGFGGPGSGRGSRGKNRIGKKALKDIQLLHTDTLIKEVERVFSTNHPDPLEIENAKKVLADHEQALADAIARLADISDSESDGGSR
ncbi:hypothetical protein LIER_05472 [Lithospermum erythrorhizon]|uniref:ENT domain-containing protein n=1 Tax=Lithospermum erythrorhizon TaxID=34254 RepID=A0AAV3P0N3_LITER